ncbi:NADH-quinone oxidoreductase subunit C [Paenibacillus sp. 1_12]|uniref:NADH-quinone oxidoreductase subunit C n=1 Tax=Paenibacillus sp. 1_12 TaxID=1566278 RepID=UPI0008E765BF|nr:NADH-quinone oxidoreductase subunit C [Paenibacillus sp. 1_12]SFL88094.1 NADH-quinone oxidoreductase subunit C [Paenibacillus sp. 1_12]
MSDEQKKDELIKNKLDNDQLQKEQQQKDEPPKVDADGAVGSSSDTKEPDQADSIPTSEEQLSAAPDTTGNSNNESPSAATTEATSASATEATGDASSVDDEQEAKAKAAAEARAARAVARAKRAEAAGVAPPAATPSSGATEAPVGEPGSADDDKEAKAKAAAEARAARASARAKKTEGEEDGAPKVPSPLQPRLDHWVKLIKEQAGEDAIEEAFINERDAHLPYILVKNEHWAGVALLLKQHCELKLNYLRNVSGIDQETHMEVAYHLLSLDTKAEVCVKVKTSREAPSIESVTPIWATANWNEREIFDLLGIDFPGHPDLRRIMMSDDWVGHPLRKDYEALDPEV